MASYGEDESCQDFGGRSDDDSKFSAQLNGSSVILSPSSEYMAIIISGRLIIRDVKTLVTVNVYSCIDKIERCAFSPDSSYVLCGMFTRNAVQVFSVTDSEWKCRINEGLAGIVNAAWAPDSRSIITESDFGIQLTIWSLVDNSSYAIAYPKQPFVATSSGSATQSVTQTTRSYGGSLFAFSDGGKYLAVVHRVELNDHIGIYTTAPWTEIAKFKCTGNDTSSIAWTPQDTHIVTTDSPLTYRLHFYSIKGDHEGSYEAYKGGLGVRAVQFYRPSRAEGISAEAKNSARLMAVSSFDGKVRLLTTTKWSLAFTYTLTHPKDMDAGVIRFVDDDDEDLDQPARVGSYPVTVEVIQAPDTAHVFASGLHSRALSTTFIKKHMKVLPKTAGDPRDSKNLPAMGVSWMDWSADGSVIATREESYPRCLWLWDSQSARLLDVILQVDAITCAQWRPAADKVQQPLLAFCCGTGRVYFWSPGIGVTCEYVPHSHTSSSSQAVTWLQWSSDAARLVLGGRESFILLELKK